MAGSSVDNKQLTVERAVLETLTLGDTSVTGISTIHTDRDIRKLTTAKALFDAFTMIKSDLDKIEGASNLYTDTSALTPGIMSITMENRRVNTSIGYEIEGFETTGVDRVYTRTMDNAVNYIRVPNANIKFSGVYIFVILVNSLTPGASLTVEDNDGTVFATLTTTGTHVVEVLINNVNVCTLSIVAHTEAIDDKIVIGKMSFHRVTDRLHEYLLHKVKGVLVAVSEAGYITEETMAATYDVLLRQISDQLNALEQQITADLESHLNKRNPHGIHPDMIFAARATHSHTPDQCGAASASHSHTPNEIGAATATHSHTPASIGAASALHDHDDRYLLKSEVIIPKLVKAAIVTDAPAGILPVNLSHTQVNPPTCILQANRLTHNAAGPMDISSGIVTSNRFTRSSVGSQIHDAVKPGKYAIFDEVDTIEYLPVIINYTLQIPREIQAIELSHGTEALAYPTEVAIYINDVLSRTVAIVYVNEIAMIVFPTPISNVSKVGLKFNTISELTSWSIGFDFIFADTHADTFFISKDTRCTFEKDLSITLSKVLTEHVPFTITNMEVDHPYFIGLSSDGSDQVVHVSSIPPEYGVVDTGTKPFLDTYTDGPTNAFYGTISATSENSAYPVENIYTADNTTFRTEPNTAAVVVSHVFKQLQSVMSVGIRFNKSEVDYIPSHMTLSATIDGGTTIQIIEIVDYIADVNNTDNDYVMLSVPVDMEVLSLSLMMENPIGSELRLAILEISLGTEFYNINKLIWKDEAQRNYVGVIYKRDTGIYDIRSYPIGDSACIPINSLNPTQSDMTYEIINPYGGKRISVSLISLTSEDDTNPLGPAAEVVKITNDKIVIKSIVGGVFAADIVRNW